MKIQDVLNELQPYVIGIRYTEGIPLVDVVLKDGWKIIDDPRIQKMKGNNDVNYYMFYTEEDGYGIDELLEYSRNVIRMNEENEKKQKLLHEKIQELKTLFSNNTLDKLMSLRFDFFAVADVPTKNLITPTEILKQEESPKIEEELTEEEREILEEEKRGEVNRMIIERKRKNKYSSAKEG
jgi:hypothetical protein